MTRRFAVFGPPGQQDACRRGPDGRVELKDSAPAEHLTMPDLDKLVRAVGDALTRIAWRDDSQIVAWHAYKHYATPEHPMGAQITIQEVRR